MSWMEAHGGARKTRDAGQNLLVPSRGNAESGLWITGAWNCSCWGRRKGGIGFPFISLGVGLGTPHPWGVCCHREAFLGSRNDQGSMLTLGAVDQSYFVGPLHWVPVTVQGYWQFTVDRWVSRTVHGPLQEADP